MGHMIVGAHWPAAEVSQKDRGYEAFCRWNGACGGPCTSLARLGAKTHHHVIHHRGHHHVTHHMSRGGTGPSDKVANQLNAQEAANHVTPGMMGAGSHGGPYGQPSPTQGIPGAYQPSASSHSPNQIGQH